MGAGGEPFEAHLQQRIERARAMRHALRARIEELEQQRRGVERRLRAAEQLYEAEFGHPVEPGSRAETNGRFSDFGWGAALLSVLGEAGKPLHVKEIWKELRDGGFRTEARDPLRSLVAIAVRNPRVVKVGPATYRLRESAQIPRPSRR